MILRPMMTPGGMGLGLLPRQTPYGQIPGVGKWDGSLDAVPMLPREQWAGGFSLELFEQRDIFQNGYPACCLASGGNVIEFLCAREGRTVKVDWLRAWRECTGGNGGYAIDAGLRYAMTKGYPLDDGSGGKNRILITEAWDAVNGDAAASGLQRGGLLWFGWHFPDGPHAEAGLWLEKNKGAWGIGTRNTHGKSYGVRGYHTIPLANVDAGIETFGGIIVREVELRSIDLAEIPDIKGIA